MNKKTQNVLLVVLFVPLVYLFTIWLRILINPDNSFFMEWYIGYVITLLGIPVAYLFSTDKSGKGKFKVWGLAVLILSALLIYSFGFSVPFYKEEDGFAAIGVWMSCFLCYL